MIATLLAFGSLYGAAVLSPVHVSALTVNVDTKEGAVLTGEYTFRVTVQSDKPVSQVEFYVGEDLRSTDSSTPYEFTLDTLAEKEGALKVTFTAYSSENESAKKSLNVTIDNGIALGPDPHVAKALALLADSKWDDAIQAGRIALKAKPGHNPARLVMARAYLGKGVLDSAQRFAEDALASDPGYTEAAGVLTTINLQRAFNTFHRGTGDPSETVGLVETALKSAVELRKKTLYNAFDAMKQTPENLLQYADAAIRAGRYSAAIQALQPAYRADGVKPALVNRIAFCQIRGSKFYDAFQTFAESRRKGTVDAYGYALLAVIAYNLGQDSVADESMTEALLSDNEDPGVRSAQAYLDIARNKRDVLAQRAQGLATDLGFLTEVQYYLMTAYSWASDYSESQRSFERAVLAEPINSAAYILRANESLTVATQTPPGVAIEPDKQKQFDHNFRVAQMFYEAALLARPDSGEALVGLSIIAGQKKDFVKSYQHAEAAAAAMPSYAAARYANAYAASKRQSDTRAAIEGIRRANKDGSLTAEQREQISRLSAEADRLGLVSAAESKAAGELDKPRLQGRGIPTLVEVQTYFLKYGRLPVMTAPR